MRLEFETFGSAENPPLVLIMGIGAQLIDWPVEFCERLAARDLYVVRFDNRDSGLSDSSDGPYVLADMAEDTVGLMDQLGIGKAHIVGMSMGGMIGQQLMVDNPGRVLSFCSIMSTTGDRSVGESSPAAVAALTRARGTTREEIIRDSVEAFKVTGSPGFETSEEELVRRATAAYDRALRPDGFQRQFQAVMASPDRTKALGDIDIPTIVIHGEDDPLIGVSGGRATAAAIPGADLMVIPGMGHELPAQLFPQIVDAIITNTHRKSKVD